MESDAQVKGLASDRSSAVHALGRQECTGMGSLLDLVIEKRVLYWLLLFSRKQELKLSDDTKAGV